VPGLSATRTEVEAAARAAVAFSEWRAIRSPSRNVAPHRSNLGRLLAMMKIED
jgi:hypothetical protein